MALKDVMKGAFARPKKSETSRERAKRAFAQGDNSAGVAALLELGEDSDPEVLFQLGECYETATGVMLNFATAAVWYERAAAKGYLPAQAKLGDFYLFGRRAHAVIDDDTKDTGTGSSRLRPKGVSVPQ